MLCDLLSKFTWHRKYSCSSQIKIYGSKSCFIAEIYHQQIVSILWPLHPFSTHLAPANLNVAGFVHKCYKYVQMIALTFQQLKPNRSYWKFVSQSAEEAKSYQQISSHAGIFEFQLFRNTNLREGTMVNMVHNQFIINLLESIEVLVTVPT